MPESPQDDWFSEPDVRASPGRPRLPVDDDWLDGEGGGRRAASQFDLRALLDRRVLVSVAVGSVFLLAVLAALGAFSGGGHPATVGTTTTSPSQPAATTSTTTPVRPKLPPPAAPLKPGDTGAQVKVLQRALASLGFLAGVADGQYGPATKRAVLAFQKAHGLTGDGIFGPKTLQALTVALSQ
jgi:hypothetical protein